MVRYVSGWHVQAVCWSMPDGGSAEFIDLAIEHAEREVNATKLTLGRRQVTRRANGAVSRCTETWLLSS